MPGNIIPANPTDVMPANLARAFHAELHLECDLNMYPDGSSDRNALALNNRAYFTMQATLLPDAYTALKSFFYAHQGVPFYFYNLRETVPPFSWDATGQNTIGRYTVVFDGAWTETYGYERNQIQGQTFQGFGVTVSLGMREVV
jgi:hypothetical protein